MKAVEAFLAAKAVALRTRLRTSLVLEEAMMNIVMHGFEQPGDQRVELAVTLPTGAVCLRLEDEGKAFDPRSAAEPTVAPSLAEAQPGGQGIPLMRRFTRSMDYERIGGRSVLTLTLDAD